MAVAPRKSSDKGLAASLVGVRKFKDMPLSGPTQRSLADSRFKELTAIQRATIPHALAGRDVLGAAKTGSGKTLAFLIPMLEVLYRAKWGRQDGIGGLVIAPTRELAMQIFQQLLAGGKHHSLSAGLLIGGKNVQEEKDTVNRMNLLVCTPGRLLQHMDETPQFDCVSLKMLVLDEADRILDLGFAATLTAILSNLPSTRQTLCFSATQTKSVKDLARLSLRDPEYLAVHAESASATPPKLQQMVAVCALDKKMETLWGFIKSHLTSKTLVFLSSCKQVRFAHEMFRRMRPGKP
jgi:ATP-dependent RNA helicase DDX10/DBP4